MKDINEPSTVPLVITDEPINNEVIKTTTTSSSKNGGNKKNTGVSSQMQLLALAKNFVLDGGLASLEKQMPLEERTQKRARVSALRKQENLEAIIKRSINYCSATEFANKADADWFSTFTELAEDVSNTTMQNLWAKILAGEISQPGSFSTKTLKIFRAMSITEAKLLAKACSLAVTEPAKRNIRIISGAYQTPSLFNFFSKNREQNIPFSQFSLSYADLLILADNHLVFIQETESTPMDKSEVFTFNFNGRPLTLVAKKSSCVLKFYKFTPVGSELARLISDNVDDAYLQHLKSAINESFSVVEG
ncbi:MAG: TIGR03899 family protein [Colwellia sp.]|jgi:uncharacterized repeat protein (TIGR03899 family)